MTKLTNPFSFKGTVGPGQYFAWGVIAFIVKYCIDRTAAALLLHQPWLPWEYLNPAGSTMYLHTPKDQRFLLVMSIIALPFIWLGVALTLRRLRSLKVTPALVLLFFIPFINLAFFILLCIVPAAGYQEVYESSPEGRRKDAIVAIVISSVICVSTALLGFRLVKYGWGLFVALPFCLGLISAVVYTWRRARSRRECILVAMATCAAVASGLLLFGLEGAICILMAAPLAVPLAALGAEVGYRLQRHALSPQHSAAMLMMLAFFPPAMIGAESKITTRVPEFAVRTSIEVNAPPERVWKNVVSFAQLPEPSTSDWLFRSGIAYPIRAEIQGHGVGAVRHCVFSTGPFVEPITVWDEPHLLEFAVTQNPPAMHELSPYPNLHPPHVEGFLVSHKGHFELVRLPGGRTRLEGVTWYEHNLWPAPYWQLWADMIIHRIHLRVLNHVKQLSESADGPS